MNRLFVTEEPDNFKNFLIMSAVIHLSLALTMALKNLVFTSKTITIPPSVRVDVVDLPDKITNTPAKKETATPPKETAKPLPKENKADSLKRTKEEQKKALEKLSAMNAIEKIRDQMKDEAKSEEPVKPKQYKGSIISSGNSFTGMARLRVNDYLDALTVQIRDHWVLPQWLSDANLKASVVMAIDSRGQLIRREIYISSGNTVFDSSCLSAIEAASPFAPPPAEVDEALILIRFPFE